MSRVVGEMIDFHRQPLSQRPPVESFAPDLNHAYRLHVKRVDAIMRMACDVGVTKIKIGFLTARIAFVLLNCAAYFGAYRLRGLIVVCYGLRIGCGETGLNDGAVIRI